MDTENYKKLIGLIIKQEREKQGLTQEVLSAKINLDQSNLSNIENGKNFPSFTSFCALVEILDIEPNMFLRFLKFKTHKKSSIDIEIEEHLKLMSDDFKLNLLGIIKNVKQ